MPSRTGGLVFLVLALCGLSAEAQVFKNAPWNKNNPCANGQCQATFGPGSIDPFGHVVVSVGPIADPAPMAPAAFSNPATADDYTHMHDYLPSAAKSVGEVSALGFRSDFRQALLKAARSERGKSIGVGEYFKIFSGSLNPVKLETARLAVIDSAIQDGVLSQADATGAIDWEKLIELLIKYLPAIIDLFTSK